MMRFSITNRKLMKMLFELGTVKEMSGNFTVGNMVRRWDISRKQKNLFRDEERYDAYISGWYDHIEGDTLDEVLDALEAKMEELAA